MDEIEERYDAEMQNAEDEFLDKIKTAKDFKKVEEEYQKKIDSIRTKFEEDSKKYFKSKKFVETQKKKIVKKEEKYLFEVKHLEMKMSFFRRLKVNFAIKKFIFERRLKNIFKRITPNKILFWKFKIKRITKDAVNDSSRKADRIKMNFAQKAKNSESKISKIFSKIFAPINNFFWKKEKEKTKNPLKTGETAKTEAIPPEEKVKNN